MFDPRLTIRTPIANLEFWKKALGYQFIYSIVGLVLGLACIIIGAALLVHGTVANTKSWTASFIGAKTSMSDVPAGAVLFVVGLLVVYVTRFIVESQQKKIQPKKKKK